MRVHCMSILPCEFAERSESYDYPGGKDHEMRRFCAVIAWYTVLFCCEVLLQTMDFRWASSTINNERSTKVAHARVPWSLRQLGYNKWKRLRMQHKISTRYKVV